MQYDFDQLISRKDTGSLKWDKYRNTDILPFWVADMDFAVAPEIQQALVDRISHPVFGYTQASDELVDALIHHLQQIYGWTIQPDWLVWMPGVVPALSACCRAYLQPGDQVMTHTPIYHHFFQVHDPDKNELLQVPLHKIDDRWTFDLDAMEAVMTPATRLIMLCSPHNPTGTVFTQEELDSLLALAKKYDAVVASDEIHCGLVLNPDTPHTPTAKASPQYADSVVTLMSQSKTFNLAGMNCSFAIISNPELRQRFEAAKVEVVSGPGTLSYASAEAAFAKGEPWRQALLDYLRENYALLEREMATLPGLQLQRCDATYLAWIDATELGLDNVAHYLEQHGIGLSAGEQFGQPGFVRLNFACPRTTLEEGISRIRRALSKL
ncbi:MAG: PatB family C-S lyase [Granulosicoccus sp.]|nr:PatB family C-S lyase [Granulosicoccus sp.]